MTLVRYCLVDSLMALPKELEVRLHDELSQYEKEKGRAYVTTVERIGIAKGRLQQGIRQGLLEGIELGLELKFGAEGLRATARQER